MAMRFMNGLNSIMNSLKHPPGLKARNKPDRRRNPTRDPKPKKPKTPPQKKKQKKKP